MIAHRHDHSVDLKRRPPKSLPAVLRDQVSRFAKAARKDSAVHVSLSSDSLVKQPETPKDPVFRFPAEAGKELEAAEARTSARARALGRMFTV